MNILKLVTLPVTIIVAFSGLLLIINLLLKHFKSRTDEDGRLRISYGVWFASLFLSGASVITTVVRIVAEAVDNLIKIHPPKIMQELLKTISSILGLSFLWFLIWYFVVKFLTMMILINRNEEQEMSSDGIAYFILKGSIFLGIILSLTVVLELLLRIFIPNVEILFYH